jgi:hypothetical protein
MAKRLPATVTMMLAASVRTPIATHRTAGDPSTQVSHDSITVAQNMNARAGANVLRAMRPESIGRGWMHISRKEGHRFTASRSMVSCHAGPVLMKQDVVDFLSATNIRQECGFLIFHRCNQRLMAIVGCADAVF